MPHSYAASDSLHDPLELVYRNGEPATSSEIVHPHFRNISLAKTSLQRIEAIVSQARKFDIVIRSDNEEEQARACYVETDRLQKELENLLRDQRSPYHDICVQISDAGKNEINQLMFAKASIRKRITDYEELKEQGRKREEERLLREAEQKKIIAQFVENPQKKNQARTEAKKLEKEAKKFAPQTTRDIAVVQHYNVIVVDRRLAAKLPEHLVKVEADEIEVNKDIREKIKSGIRITENLYQGLKLIPETRVRFH
jgi:hypothetical protein